MPPQRAPRIKPSRWLEHKSLLEKYWVTEDRTIPQVVELMKGHGFEATFSQYEAQFKAWKWQKNQKSQDWKAVAYAIHEMERNAKPWEVYLDGELQPASKVLDKIKPYDTQRGHSVPQQLPTRFAVVAPPVDSPELTSNLPFEAINEIINRSGATMLQHAGSQAELKLGGGTDIPTSSPGPLVDDQTSGSIVLNEQQNLALANRNALTEERFLQNVIPGSLSMPAATTDDEAENNKTIELFRKVLFSISNNFAGLESLPKKNVIDFLAAVTTKDLYKSIRAASAHSTSSLTQNLLLAAIEAGNSSLVDLILTESVIEFDVGSIIIRTNRCKWTPIEWAATELNGDLLLVLIKHGFSITRTVVSSSGVRDNVREDPHKSLLDRVISYLEYRLATWTPHNARLDSVFRILLNAGSSICISHTRLLLGHGYLDLVSLAITTRLRYHREDYRQEDYRQEHNLAALLSLIIQKFDQDETIKLVHIILKSWGQLLVNDGSYDGSLTHGDYVNSPLDFAAQRGYLQLFKMLRTYGFPLTRITLSNAILGRNHELINAIVEQDWNSIAAVDTMVGTPLSNAIKLKDAEAVQLLIRYGALNTLTDIRGAHLSHALMAAAKVGNTALIMEFLKKGVPDSKCLGSALLSALGSGKEEAARLLIDAGADVNQISEKKKWSSLQLAINGGCSLNLVEVLLHAGGHPQGQCNGIYRETPLGLAISAQDLAMVRTLLEAGTDLNDSCELDPGEGHYLEQALANPDERIIDCLLSFGATIQTSWLNPDLEGYALRVAVKFHSLDIVRKILDLGGHPGDSLSLEQAEIRSPAMLDLLLTDFHKKYPRGLPGFAAPVLQTAISNCNERLFVELLEHGADPNYLYPIDNRKREAFDKVSALGFAIINSPKVDTGAMELLITRRYCEPDVTVAAKVFGNYRGNTAGGSREYRYTALMVAILVQSHVAVRSLLKLGADPNKNPLGTVVHSPLQLAAKVGDVTLIDLLIKHGADVNAAPALSYGGTALQMASEGGFGAIVVLLLSHGADVSAAGSRVEGMTALEFAVSKGRIDVVKILLNAGAGIDLLGIGVDSVVLNKCMELATKHQHQPICNLLQTYLWENEALCMNVGNGAWNQFGAVGDEQGFVEDLGDDTILGDGVIT